MVQSESPGSLFPPSETVRGRRRGAESGRCSERYVETEEYKGTERDRSRQRNVEIHRGKQRP